jgi:hypothetical protein
MPMSEFFTLTLRMTKPVDLYDINHSKNVQGKNKGIRIGLLFVPTIEQKQYSMGNLPYL